MMVELTELLIFWLCLYTFLGGYEIVLLGRLWIVEYSFGRHFFLGVGSRLPSESCLSRIFPFELSWFCLFLPYFSFYLSSWLFDVDTRLRLRPRTWPRRFFVKNQNDEMMKRTDFLCNIRYTRVMGNLPATTTTGVFFYGLVLWCSWMVWLFGVRYADIRPYNMRVLRLWLSYLMMAMVMSLILILSGSRARACWYSYNSWSELYTDRGGCACSS